VTTLSIVTTVWGEHRQWVDEWMAAVLDSRRRPTEVVIVVGDAEAYRAAHRHAGHARVVLPPAVDGMGRFRNTAVAAAASEWVMHLDVDDLLLPHAVGDVLDLAQPETGVVSVGCVRNGRAECYPDVTTEHILAGRHGAFSGSAFRRELWEQAPWRTDTEYVDSLFWLGLAKLGARFVGTQRPGFIYRQHEGSFGHQLTPAERAVARRQFRDAVAE
jgi:Glycosyl transferase family 2